MTATELQTVAPAVATPLAMRAITKRWPGVDTPVLNDVDLTVEPGTAVSITGRNGSGKTTLLRIAAGLLAPDQGTVRVANLDPERQRRTYQRRVGFVSAGNGALYARLTVDHHLELASRLALPPRRERGAAGTRTLQRFELDELRGPRGDRPSTGPRPPRRPPLGGPARAPSPRPRLPARARAHAPRRARELARRRGDRATRARD